MVYGFGAEDYADDGGVEVWPDNLPATNTFVAMATQWRMGHSGAIGLDYNALPAVLRLTGVPRPQWPDVFDCIRILEEEAMACMREAKADG